MPGVEGEHVAARVQPVPAAPQHLAARDVHPAGKDECRCPRHQVLQVADDRRLAGGEIDLLDGVGETGPRLPAENPDPRARPGHRRVPDGHRQRRHPAEVPAIGGGKHAGLVPGAVVPAGQVGGAADGDR
jgi:hypothetical protein